MNPNPEIVRVKLKKTVDKSYDLVIGHDLAQRMIEELKARGKNRHYMVIADSTVMKLYGDPLTAELRAAGLKADRIAFPAGEASKSRKMKQLLEERMFEMRMSRDGCVIAVGGGVTSDLAGFTAATYQRGIPWIICPTSLLAMLDASIGGKTGIDVPEGKNLIGAFHQPEAVYMDVAALETMPRRRLLAGMAEAVKHAVIHDRDYFKLLEDRSEEMIEGGPEAQLDIIRESCRIKAQVVAADEKEEDLRRILNFGHTLGHAFESLSNYSLLHGEAVSLGMAMESELAVSLGILPEEEKERIKALLKRLGLPVKAQVVLKALIGRPLRPKEVLEATHADKKVRQGMVEYVFPTRIGQMKRLKKKSGIPVNDKTALDFLRRQLR